MERRPTRLRGALLSAAVAAPLVVLSAYYVLTAPTSSSSAVSIAGGPNVIGSSSTTRVFDAPRPNIWADLTQHEADDVYGFLVRQWPDLNLTRAPKAPTDNFVATLETLPPNKTQALPYLHGDNNQSARPERWAKALLSHYDDISGPQLAYYAVGPLPVSAATRVAPLTYPFVHGRHAVANLRADFLSAGAFALDLAENVSDITTALLGAKVNRADPRDPDALTAVPRFTRVGDTDLVLGWIQFFRPGMGSSGRTLLPQGIYARVDASKAVDEWTVDKWFYNGQLFDDVDQFRRALRDPDGSGFLRTKPNVDGAWTDTEDFDARPAGRELPPPVSIQPLGPRYQLDKTERFVSWFGFEFYLASTPATGLGLFDIRFRGERVMYELSLQEALAHYAGDDPMAGGQEFLDAFFGMGTNAFELLPGYDCPAYADYLGAELHRSGRTEARPNNVCVFEFTSDYLLSRHAAQYSVTASRNTFLTVRTVATVGNYDYTVDYVFYLDGAIEVKVRASGYIFGAFYASHKSGYEGEYGHRVHDALASSLHDHVISFKADLDVAGTANDMVRLAVEPTTVSYPWDQPYVEARNTMHLVEYNVTHEAGLVWPANAGEFFLVYSADQKNAWGERKGYRVVSGTGMGNTPHLTIVNSTSLGTSATWAEKDVWVVRHKDHEPRGADPLNYIAPHEPLVEFAQIANAESLVRDDEYDGDLVVYFNVGSHHIPHSGDIPNTLMHTSASSVMFVPHNFADRDPSRASVQGVRYQLKGTDSGGFAGFPNPDADNGDGDGGGVEDLKNREKTRSSGGDEKAGYQRHQGVNYFGTPYTAGVQVPLEALEPDLARTYQSREILVSDLGLNGSAVGLYAA